MYKGFLYSVTYDSEKLETITNWEREIKSSLPDGTFCLLR